jgi:methylated-DNA-[protein]-cysteine S-methyltransferase
VLKKASPETPSPKLSCQKIDSIIKNIQAFLAGEKINFNLDILDFDLCSDFQKKVILEVFKISGGSTKTYQEIAKNLGVLNGARAVGNALAQNPFPLIIPCHRVIKSDGSLGQYQGGTEMKQQLLKIEGVKSFS